MPIAVALFAVVQRPTSDCGSGQVIAGFVIAMASGCFLMGVGTLWLAAVPAMDLSLAPVLVPLILVGAGIALAVSAVTAVAVNTVPNHLAGMSSGSTSMLRDFGFTLGPAVVGAVHAVAAGPLGASAMPATVPGPGGRPVPFNPLQDVAFHALSSAYPIGYMTCGIAALVAAVLTVVAGHGRMHETLPGPRTLAED